MFSERTGTGRPTGTVQDQNNVVSVAESDHTDHTAWKVDKETILQTIG